MQALNPPDLRPGVADIWLLMVTFLCVDFEVAALMRRAEAGVPGCFLPVDLGVADRLGLGAAAPLVLGLSVFTFLGVGVLSATDLFVPGDFGGVGLLVPDALGLPECGGVRSPIQTPLGLRDFLALAEAGAAMTSGLANLGDESFLRLTDHGVTDPGVAKTSGLANLGVAGFLGLADLGVDSFLGRPGLGVAVFGVDSDLVRPDLGVEGAL